MRELEPPPYRVGIPFELDGQLLMFVQEQSHRDVQIVGSDDGGVSWSDPVTVLEGPLWNISTARLVRDERIFFGMDHDLPGAGHGGKVMAKCDRSRSLFNPDARSLSKNTPPRAWPP